MTSVIDEARARWGSQRRWRSKMREPYWWLLRQRIIYIPRIPILPQLPPALEAGHGRVPLSQYIDLGLLAHLEARTTHGKPAMTEAEALALARRVRKARRRKQ